MGQRPRLLPWLMLLFLGSAALAGWFLFAPSIGSAAYFRPGPVRSPYGFNWQILLLFVPFVLALVAWRRGARAPVWLLLAGAGLLHLLMLFAPPPQSQDFFSYLFYGRIQSAHHANPYVVLPSAFNSDPWYGWIRWRTQTSLYGPVWSLISFGVTKAAGDRLSYAFAGLKLVILAIDAAIMAMLVAAARGRPDEEGTAGWGLLAYAWNPMVLITVPLGGSADVAVAGAFVGAVLARRRSRTWLATGLLALATLVKVYAGVGLLLHLVLLASERGRKEALRNAAGAAAMGAAAYAPYWAGWDTFRGFIGLVDLSNASLTGMLQRLLVPVLGWLGLDAAREDAVAIVRWMVAALVLVAVVWAVRRIWQSGDLWEPVLFVLCLYLLLTPWYMYWYLLAPLALAAVLPRNRLTYPVLTFSGTSLITVSFNPLLAGQVVQTILRYVPPLAIYRGWRWPARIHTRWRTITLPEPASGDGLRREGSGKVPEEAPITK